MSGSDARLTAVKTSKVTFDTTLESRELKETYASDKNSFEFYVDDIRFPQSANEYSLP